MLSLLLPLALRMGVPARLARPLVVGALVLLAILALGAGKCALVQDHEAKVTAKITRSEIKAERRANASEAADRAADEANAHILEKEIANAVQAKPEEARRPAGPAVNAALGELRRRTAEGR